MSGPGIFFYYIYKPIVLQQRNHVVSGRQRLAHAPSPPSLRVPLIKTYTAVSVSFSTAETKKSRRSIDLLPFFIVIWPL